MKVKELPSILAERYIIVSGAPLDAKRYERERYGFTDDVHRIFKNREEYIEACEEGRSAINDEYGEQEVIALWAKGGRRKCSTLVIYIRGGHS